MAGVSLEALQRVLLFEDLAASELQAVADSMHERAFRPGEVVTAEGAVGDGFFVVESGEAAVSVAGQPRGAIRPGDHFGEIALLMGSNRTATVTATSDLRCYALTPLEFRTVVEGNPSIAWKVLQSMAERMS